MKQPWLKFYPADWRADPALRSCSLAARGLWMEMLCLMHEALGALTVNGNSLGARQLASLAGVTQRECERLLAELEAAGVFSRETDGTIFSRRIRRDLDKAERDRLNGKGGGNPKLTKGVNPQDKPEDKAQKLETRYHINSSSTARGAFEHECRQRIDSEPVLCDPDFSPIRTLVDQGDVTEGDVLLGIAAAMTEPNFRIRHWNQLVGWARRAAKDRLVGVSKSPTTGPPRQTPKKSAFAIVAELRAEREQSHHSPDRSPSASPVTIEG